MTAPDSKQVADDGRELWGDKPFKEALQDVVARYSTGYDYHQLDEIPEDELDADDERREIDKQVNLLAHFFSYYSTKDRQIAELKARRETADYLLSGSLDYEDFVRRVTERIAQLDKQIKQLEENE